MWQRTNPPITIGSSNKKKRRIVEVCYSLLEEEGELNPPANGNHQWCGEGGFKKRYCLTFAPAGHEKKEKKITKGRDSQIAVKM